MNLEQLPFEHSYAGLPAHFHARVAPTPVSKPRLVQLNRPLAHYLGLDPALLESEAGVAMLAGNRLPESALPLAMAYAGHQFGHFVPQLGDGRAVLLGELLARDGIRHDIQIKGAGRTPFSRGGDGRAALRPMVREYLASEAMAALGVPTQRALALLETGEEVWREEAEPGGLLIRVARSHIRVGTFEYFFRNGDHEAVRILADYVIDRHYPDVREAANPYLALLKGISERTADLIADWLAVGFIHGVMNTDNLSVTGETIDYGPFGFMDEFDPGQVYSSIDRGGRYAYNRQPAIAHWNLTRLAETLLPLLDPDEKKAVATAEQSLDSFAPRFEAAWQAALRRKLGLTGGQADDEALVTELLGCMSEQRADYTLVFRALSWLPDDPSSDDGAADETLRALFANTHRLDAWLTRWRARLAQQATPESERQQAMQATNPAYILRNHLAERAVDQAAEGDYSTFNDLLTVLGDPFSEHPGYEHYARPPKPDERVVQTFCGT